MSSPSHAHSSDHHPVWALTGSIGLKSVPLTVRIDQSPFLVGRRPDAQLSLLSGVVSSEHAVLTLRGDSLWVRDQHSTNGTWLNGRQIDREVQLTSGDWLEFGDAIFQVHHHQTPVSLPNTPSQMQTTVCRSSRIDNAAPMLTLLLQTKALAACFQPICVSNTLEIHGYEFLARSAIDGVRDPAAMFSAAEKTGRAVELSELCRDCAMQHSLLLPSSAPVFLNTHPAESLIETVLPQMRQIRRDYPERAIVLEIHEAAVTDPALIRMFREQLSAVNIQLAFDDIGSGQTRLRELICTPAHYIKFAPTLIHDLRDFSKAQLRFIRSIVERIHDAGTRTIAEGVESEELADACRKTGIDLLQGWLFGGPSRLENPSAHLRLSPKSVCLRED